MRWEDGPQSSNIEDRRGGGGGGRGPKLAVGGIGGVVLLVGALVLGIDPSFLITDQGPAPSTNGGASKKMTPEDNQKKRFVASVLGSTEEAWTKVFKQQGKRYKLSLIHI